LNAAGAKGAPGMVLTFTQTVNGRYQSQAVFFLKEELLTKILRTII
jgi:hypothetical protein